MSGDSRLNKASADSSKETLIGVVFRDREDFGRFVEKFEAQEPGIPVLLSTWVLEHLDGSVEAVFKVSEGRSIVERALSVYRTSRPVEIIEKRPDGARFLIGPENGVEEPYTLDFKAFLRLLSLIGFTSVAGLRDLSNPNPSKSSENSSGEPANTSANTNRSTHQQKEAPQQGVAEQSSRSSNDSTVTVQQPKVETTKTLSELESVEQIVQTVREEHPSKRDAKHGKWSTTSIEAVEYVPPEDVQAVKKWVAEEYLEAFAGPIRRILEEIVDNLSIDIVQKTVSLGTKTASLNNLRNDRSTIGALLEPYRQRLGKHFEAAVEAVANIVADTVRLLKKPFIPVEVKNITIREQLADVLAKYILDKVVVKTFKVDDSILGIYCYDEGVYVECESEIKQMMWEAVKDRDDLRPKTTRWVINEALHKIMLETMHDLRYEPLKIAFKNVVFDWEMFLKTGSIRLSVEPFNPETIVFHRIPHRLALDKLESLEGLLKYSENLVVTNLEELAQKLCPRTLRAFKDWIGEKWPLLFEILGYTLYPKYDLHKAVMLVGDGSNGKSTYLRLVKVILGSQNVVSIPLQDLTNEKSRFAAAQLYRKLANIYADLPSTALKATGVFKMLTGEDPITADRKWRDPITFTNYAKLIFSANELPPVNDMTFAFWRRWIVIEFPNKFPEDPTFFERTFTEDEIEGIIIVALYAFRNVWIRKRFSFEESHEDSKRKWLRNVNTVYAFMEDLLAGKIPGYRAKLDPEGVVEKDALYNLYVQYCSNEDMEAVDKRRFTMELERLYGIRTHGRGKKFYKGLKLESENDKQTKLIPD